MPRDDTLDDMPKWHPAGTPARCPYTLDVTASKTNRYVYAAERWNGRVLYQETEIQLATEWHWETREKGQDDG